MTKKDSDIGQMFLLDLCKMVRSIPGPTIPVLMWLSPSVGASMRIFGPEELRGLGDIASKAELLAAENGGTASELEIEVFLPRFLSVGSRSLTLHSCTDPPKANLSACLTELLYTTMNYSHRDMTSMYVDLSNTSISTKS